MSLCPSSYRTPASSHHENVALFQHHVVLGSSLALCLARRSGHCLFIGVDSTSRSITDGPFTPDCRFALPQRFAEGGDIVQGLGRAEVSSIACYRPTCKLGDSSGCSVKLKALELTPLALS